jgi:hypothetical protein
VPPLISATIRLDSAGSVSALVQQHAEVAAGFRITQFIRPAERGLSAGEVAAIRERATEVECGIGVSALGGATVGLDGAGRIALLVEHTREVERSARVTLVIGRAVRLFRTRQVTCCLEALAEFERRVSGDGPPPDPRGGVRGRNLIGVGPTTPFPDALSRRFKRLGGPLGNFGGALFGPGRATRPHRL